MSMSTKLSTGDVNNKASDNSGLLKEIQRIRFHFSQKTCFAKYCLSNNVCSYSLHEKREIGLEDTCQFL